MTKPHILFVCDDPTGFDPWLERARTANIPYEVWYTTPTSQEQPQKLDKFNTAVEWITQTKNNFKQIILEKLAFGLPQTALMFTAVHVGTLSQLTLSIQPSGRLIGFSPMSLLRDMASVTLSRHLQTPDETMRRAEQMFDQLALEPRWINDTPGMILPRIYAMLVNEACFLLQEQGATVSDIDTAMKLGVNYPMGPFEWADKVGVDIVLEILESLWHVYREERYRPCVLLQQMVACQKLGQKTGQGFYEKNFYETNVIVHPKTPEACC